MKRKLSLKKRRKESGQALVEFVLVLPLFLAILFGIIDFGWLFYNYISVENSARDAARIACVEYEKINLKTDGSKLKGTPPENPTVSYDPVPYIGFDFDADDSYSANTYGLYHYYYLTPSGIQYPMNEVHDLIRAALGGKPDSVTYQSIDVTYSYDQSRSPSYYDWYVAERTKGDVTVTVKAKMPVLTPILGVFSDHGYMNLSSSSTFKVEARTSTDSPIVIENLPESSTED